MIINNLSSSGKIGVDGKNGQDGLTPHIGDNGNWFLGETDTGVKAIGQDGESGKRSFVFQLTLLADSWVDNAQTITHESIFKDGFYYTISPKYDMSTLYGESKIYADDVTEDGIITFHCETVPTSDLIVIILQTEIEKDLSIALERIEIVTPPNKTHYVEGEQFDTTGMVVRAYYSDDTFDTITGYSYTPKEINLGDENVTLIYSWRGNVCSVDQPVTVEERPRIYGAEWDGTSTTLWTRTDDAANFEDPVPYVAGATEYSSPFDNIYPWSGMVRVTDEIAGELVAIPKFYYKWTKNGSAMKLQISNKPVEGFYVSPAHMDRGDGYGERDIVYVGRYHCNGEYKSITECVPKVSITRSEARTGISDLGEEIWQCDFALHWTIGMLYLVEFADWDSQLKIGFGCSDTTTVKNSGQTDLMLYHTGTTASDRSTYGFCQYRNIESLWDSCYDWMDGCYCSSNKLYVIMNPANFSNTSNGTSIGDVLTSNGTVSAFTISEEYGFEWALLPSKVLGTNTSYVTDLWSYGYSCNTLRRGGRALLTRDLGLFYIGFAPGTDSSTMCGCRLMKLPNPTTTTTEE